jgi:hypothetical protein
VVAGMELTAILLMVDTTSWGPDLIISETTPPDLCSFLDSIAASDIEQIQVHLFEYINGPWEQLFRIERTIRHKVPLWMSCRVIKTVSSKLPPGCQPHLCTFLLIRTVVQLQKRF